jgi:hypothetical protein
MYQGNLCIFNNMLKNIHPKNPFCEKVKMSKKITIFESFVIIGSFDCDCTQINGEPFPQIFTKYLIILQKIKIKIIKQ